MCKYCEQKLGTNEYCFEPYDNQIKIAEGGWTSVYIGLNEKGEYVLRGLGDNNTDDCLIDYCPFCGRKLRLSESFWDIENKWNIETDKKGVNNVDIQ